MIARDRIDDDRIGGLLAAALAFVVIALSAGLRNTNYNNYVLLADAFLHGRVWIDWPGPYIDATEWLGKRYVIEAPVPALLLMPFVALFHSANQTTEAILLASAGVWAAWELARRLGCALEARVWLAIFLVAGTDYWWCAMLGDVWFLAHIGGAVFTLFALWELAGARRGWLVMLFAILAAGCRFTMVLAIPVYLVMLACRRERSAISRALAGAAAVFAVGAGAWVWYNLARWGVPYDIGYQHWYESDPAGQPGGRPFMLQYLPMEVNAFFLLGPQFTPAFPYVVPTLSGLALTWTSPALLAAFFARRPAPLVVALWILTALTAGPNFVYYVIGFAQFGMRHALDFEPYLYALMALAFTRGVAWWWQLLIAYSAIVGAWGVWYWNAFYRHTS